MINDEWQAIKDYMGFESFNEWKEYWAELEGVDCLLYTSQMPAFVIK